MRPHIEFIHQDQLPWQEGFLPGTQERVMSSDPESREGSVLVQFPSGWSQPEPRTLEFTEEFFVLAGEISVDDETFTEMNYGRIAAGTTLAAAASGPGAIVVMFRDLPADRADTDEAPVSATVKVDVLETLPSPMRTPDFPNPHGVKRIDLFDDPITGESTWILAGPALHAGNKPEVHPVVEEMFLVAGEMHSPIGVMQPGAYFWRPPHIWHGPFSSISGGVCLFRTRGGPLSTTYSETPEELPWFAPDAPILPEGLALAPRQDRFEQWTSNRSALG